MLDPLPNYKSVAWDSTFECPVGVWRARLDAKAWGKRRNILLYFCELGTENQYCISVFNETYHAADDRRIDFRRTGEPGQLFELQTAKTRTGRTRFVSARIIAEPENNDPDDTAAPEALMPVS